MKKILIALSVIVLAAGCRSVAPEMDSSDFVSIGEEITDLILEIRY